MSRAVSLTLNEAGYVVERSSTAINRAVDRGVIKAKLQRRGKHRLRKVGPAELRYLAIAGLVEKDLTPAARKKVYEAVRKLPPEAKRLDLGVMELKLSEIDHRISERLQRLEEVKTFVDERPSGEAVLRGTRVPVHVIAALAKGQSAGEIVEDYPELKADQIEAAVEYAKVYPRTGRPLPIRSFKRLLGDLATSGAWDLEDDGEPGEPRPIP